MCITRRLTIVLSIATILPWGLSVSRARAQPRIERRPGARLQIRSPGDRFEVEAVAGQPFGVGRITFELPPDMLPEPLGIEGIGLSEKARPRAVSGRSTIRPSANS